MHLFCIHSKASKWLASDTKGTVLDESTKYKRTGKNTCVYILIYNFK